MKYNQSHMLFQFNYKQNFKKNNTHTFNCILHLALNIKIYTLYIELFSFTIISGAHQNLVRPSGSFAAAVAGFWSCKLLLSPILVDDPMGFGHFFVFQVAQSPSQSPHPPNLVSGAGVLHNSLHLFLCLEDQAVACHTGSIRHTISK